MKKQDVINALVARAVDSYSWRARHDFVWSVYYPNWLAWVLDTHQFNATYDGRKADERRILEALASDGLVYVNEFDEVNKSQPYGKRNYRYYVTEDFVRQFWPALKAGLIARLEDEIAKCRVWFLDYWTNGPHDQYDLANMARDESEMQRMERTIICLENGIDPNLA